jgi:hypothetical protein
MIYIFNVWLKSYPNNLNYQYEESIFIYTVSYYVNLF